jgi:hypothetical protein
MAQLSIQFICRSKHLVSLGVLKGGILMRITDDQNVHKVKDFVLIEIFKYEKNYSHTISGTRSCQIQYQWRLILIRKIL